MNNNNKEINMKNENMERKVFLEELIKRGNGDATINWLKSIGYKVRFTYDDIEGEIEIIDYDTDNRKLLVKYLDNPKTEINTSSFLNCGIANVLGIKTSEFKVQIGQIFKDDKRDIIITSRKVMLSNNGKCTLNLKMYKYKCNKCGFECGEHYKDGEFKEELWVNESNLLNGVGCSCCCRNPQIVVEDINSIVANEETHWMIKYFKGGYEEAKMYTKSSNQKIYPICPDCGRVKDREMKINTIFNSCSIGCFCNDGISYPEKFMFNVLEQLGLTFKTQLNKTIFNWCDKYRYDFYFEFNNDKYIIETHGIQHYEDRNKSKVKDVKENDRLKKELALVNGIKEENYIIVDCRYSTLEWIKKYVLKSKIKELFNLNSIDWDKVQKYACSNLIKKACEYKRNNPIMSTGEIGNIMGYTYNTIASWLKIGNEYSWCNYDVNIEIKNRNIKNSLRKSIEIFKDGISLGIFESAKELERQSEELFGVRLLNSKISMVCNGKKPQYKGYIFNFI